MNEMDTLSVERGEMTLNKHMTKSFLWVFAALLVTAVTAFLTAATGLWTVIFSNDFIYLGMIILELVLATYLGARVEKMSFGAAVACLLGYAILTGLTFSALIIVFTPASIGLAFGFAALLFLDLAFIGITTKFDLTSIKPLLFGGLMMMVIISVVGMFINLSTMEVGICLVGIVVFMGLTAYDTQNIKRLYYMGENDSKLLSKLAIYSALELYLDFINIFLYIVRIIGRRRND